jgi:hypothetical protein
MPVESRMGLPVLAIRSKRSGLLTSPEAIFQAGMPIRSSRSTASSENGELRKIKPRS